VISVALLVLFVIVLALVGVDAVLRGAELLGFTLLGAAAAGIAWALTLSITP
jgi:hypothetical protein